MLLCVDWVWGVCSCVRRWLARFDHFPQLYSLAADSCCCWPQFSSSSSSIYLDQSYYPPHKRRYRRAILLTSRKFDAPVMFSPGVLHDNALYFSRIVLSIHFFLFFFPRGFLAHFTRAVEEAHLTRHTYSPPRIYWVIEYYTHDNNKIHTSKNIRREKKYKKKRGSNKDTGRGIYVGKEKIETKQRLSALSDRYLSVCKRVVSDRYLFFSLFLFRW